MPLHDKGLAKLAEECGELTQAAMKKAAFMNSETHPDGSKTDRRLEEEIADVMAACQYVIETLNLDRKFIHERTEKKVNIFFSWDKTND
jgi:NTP pyrophosphatase (non-canonical NTP hydrolase)